MAPEPAVVGHSCPLWAAHYSAIVDGIDHAVDSTTEIVAKHKPASTFSDEQSNRQLSAGASQRTGPWLTIPAHAHLARRRDATLAGLVLLSPQRGYPGHADRRSLA